MFFWQTSTLAYVTAKTVEIFLVSKKQKITLEFPTTAVRHLEVVDQQSLNKSLTEALEPLKLDKQHLILLLAPELIFAKGFEVKPKQDLEALENEFRDVLPFAESDILMLRTMNQKTVAFLATSGSLIVGLQTAFETQDWSIEGAYAVGLFPGIKLPLSSDGVATILKQIAQQKKNDFLKVTPQITTAEELNENEEEETISAGEPTPANDKKKQIALLALAVGLFVFCGGLLWWNAGRTTSQPQVAASPSPEVIPSPVASASATPTSQQSKTEITISIRNGSGVSGQATTLKTLLTERGFSGTIETGNAAAQTGSTIYFSDKIDLATQTEMKSILEGALGAQPQTTASSSGATSDVVITTGR